MAIQNRRRHKRMRKNARELAEKEVQLATNPQFMKRERVVRGPGVVQRGALWPRMQIPGAARRLDLERHVAAVAKEALVRGVVPPVTYKPKPKRVPLPAVTVAVATIASPPTTRQTAKGHSKAKAPRGPEVSKTAQGGHVGGARKGKKDSP